MSTFMDRHDVPGISAEEVARAHTQDLLVQDKHGVRFLTYWCDEDRGAVFCLAEGPNAEAMEQVHRESHGLVPHTILEVDPRSVSSFLGSIVDPEPGTPWTASAFRTIMFTDVVGSTSMIERIGDVAAKEIVLSLEKRIDEHLARSSGTRVDHTGDGIMAAFHSAADAVSCALALQEAVTARSGDPVPVQIRIGIAAGEPIVEGERFFGAAVNLAARLCAAAEPGTVYVPAAVRELTLGKGFTYIDRGRATLKGFSEPVQLFEVSSGTH
jgi:class 3 adenylate cyclase